MTAESSDLRQAVNNNGAPNLDDPQPQRERATAVAAIFAAGSSDSPTWTPEAGLGSSSDAPVEPLGRTAAVGVLWLTAQKWVVRLSGFVTIAVLTRLISPEDFGVVAAASTVTPFVLLLADLGLSTYLVQAKEVDNRTLSTAFWFSLTAGTILAGGMALLAPLLAEVFNVPEATPVLRAMSISALIVVAASVPSALLRRRLQFRLIALQATVGGIAAQVIAVGLALAHAGAWALVAQVLVSQGIASALAWRSAAWLPSCRFEVQQLKVMARFGAQVMAVDAVASVRAASEAAVISHALGPAALGYLTIAQRLVLTAQDVGASAIVPVSTAVFAKVRDSRERLRAGYLRALRIGYAAAAPLLTLIVAAAPILIPMIFGPGWEESVPVARGLAVAAILVLGATIDHGLHYGCGAPGRWFAYAVVVDAITLGTTFLLAPLGLVFVAWGFVAVALLATVARWFLVSRLIALRAWTLALSFLRDMLPVATSALVGIGVLAALSGFSDLVALTLTSVAIGLAHLAVLRLTGREVLGDVLRVLPIRPRSIRIQVRAS